MAVSSSPQPTAPVQRAFLVAVAGNPNSGKTTLFNALTGLRHKVGNYPGVTVEKREAYLSGNRSIQLLDLPGIYSLSARSPDETISRDVLLGHAPDTRKPNAILVVIDATNLERNLFLASQIIELGIPTVVACNMMDLLQREGHKLDVEKLGRLLGVPVIATVGSRGQGVNAIRSALESVCSPTTAVGAHRRWSLGESLEREIQTITSAIISCGYTSATIAPGAAILLLSESKSPGHEHLPKPIIESVTAAHKRLSDEYNKDVSFEIIASRYAWLREIVDTCLTRSKTHRPSTTDRLDRILTHRPWGHLIFAVVMAVMFYSIFALADPLMGFIQDGISQLQTAVTHVLPAGVFRDLLRNGILAGVGGVLTFFPQICILFLFIALLEDSGYMSRAAFLMNRLMNRVGLHGKSFIPLLSCHACAIPGIMAARTIENPRDRLATILVAPLMSCSARLPVYTLLIAACLPVSATSRAAVMFAMYLLGIVMAGLAAKVFKRTLLKGPAPGFIIELPPYRIPRPKAVFLVMWDRSKVFLTKAGTVILSITIILWALTSYPKNTERAAHFEARRTHLTQSFDGQDKAELERQLAELNNQENAENIRHSAAGYIGRVIEPTLRPLGFNWEIGIGLLASFAAREVFVGTMGIVYSVGEAEETSVPLLQQIKAATWPDGSPVFTPLVAVGLMVFFVLACQCMGTLAVVRQETNSWRWPIFMLAYTTTLAYVAALLIHQIGSALGL